MFWTNIGQKKIVFGIYMYTFIDIYILCMNDDVE